MSKYFIGLLLVVLGVLFLFNEAGIIAFDLWGTITTFWPILIIVWGLKVTLDGIRDYFRRLGSGTLIFGLFLVVLGVSLQGSRLNLFTFGDIWPWIWPFFLIILGLLFIFRRKSPTLTVHVDTGLFSDKRNGKYYDDEDYEGEYEHQGTVYRKSFIGSINLGRSTWEVGKANLWTGIGDIDIDFSKAILKDGVNTVDLSGWIGDVQVYIPEEMPVKIITDLKVGEVDVFNETSSGTNRSVQYVSPNYNDADKKLKLNISLLIGDVDIKKV